MDKDSIDHDSISKDFDFYGDNVIQTIQELNDYVSKLKNKEITFNKDIYLEYIYNFFYNMGESKNKLFSDDSIKNKDLAWCNKGLDVCEMMPGIYVGIGMDNGILYSEMIDIIKKADPKIKITT